MNVLLKLAPLIRYKEIRVMIYTLTSGRPEFSLYKAIREKDHLNVECLIENSSQPELLTNKQYHLSAEIPVILSLQGEGLVQRIYTGKPADLNKYIPNIDLRDYLFQYDEPDHERTFVALLRKDKVLSILGELSSQNIFIGKIFLGFAGVIEFIPSLGLNTQKLYAGSHFLEWEHERIVSIGKSDHVNNSGTADDQLRREGSKAVATGIAVSFFVHSLEKGAERSPIETNHLKELIAAKLSALILKCLFPVLLGILVINFFVFNELNGKLQSVDLTRKDKEKIALQIDRLKKEIDTEKELAVKLHMTGPHVFAYYFDRLAALNVSGIRFEELTVDPVHPKIRADEMIGFSQGSVVIKGTADGSESFSKLLVQLNTVGWIKKISRQTYTYNQETGKAQFEVVIDYKRVDPQ